MLEQGERDAWKISAHVGAAWVNNAAVPLDVKDKGSLSLVAAAPALPLLVLRAGRACLFCLPLVSHLSLTALGRGAGLAYRWENPGHWFVTEAGLLSSGSDRYCMDVGLVQRSAAAGLQTRPAEGRTGGCVKSGVEQILSESQTTKKPAPWESGKTLLKTRCQSNTLGEYVLHCPLSGSKRQ